MAKSHGVHLLCNEHRVKMPESILTQLDDGTANNAETKANHASNEEAWEARKAEQPAKTTQNNWGRASSPYIARTQ
jgi:hypothetical protein